MYNQGISHEGLLVDLGDELGFVDKAGAWYSYGETRLGQGRENAKTFLQENPEIAKEIEVKVLGELGITRGQSANEEPDDDESDGGSADD